MQAARGIYQFVSGANSEPKGWRWSLLLCFLLPALVWGQYQEPPRLATVVPPGVQAGQAVEVTLTGKDLDDVSKLHFSHAGLKAERMADPPPDKKSKDKKPPVHPVRFKVTAAANVPPGVYDVWAYGPEGISSCRAFVVGALPEFQEKENNNDVPEAQKIDLNSTVNGVIGVKTDVDYYVFAGKKGSRVVVACRGWSIDSKLHSLVQVYSEKGTELASRQVTLDDTVVDVVLPEDGMYLVRVCAFAYLVGGADAFYRLTVTEGPWIEAVFPPVVQPGQTTALQVIGRNLPGGKPLPVGRRRGPTLEATTVQVTAPASAASSFAATYLPRAFSVDAFEYRARNGARLSNPALLVYAHHPVVVEQEPNDFPNSEPQYVTLPCEVCGRIDKLRDRDWYGFDAKKGDVIVLEGTADRLGGRLDLFLQIWQLEPLKILGEFDGHDQLPAMIGQFWTYTDDPRARFVAPEDGKYLVYVGSRSASTRGGPEYVYRLEMRHEESDFRLIVVDNMEGDAGLNLRQNGHHFLPVLCYRQDGFNEEVLLEALGLPSGVSMKPQVIGPRATQAGVVLSVAGNAPPGLHEIRLRGTAVVEGKKLVRQAAVGTLVWPNPQKNAPALSRLTSALALAVSKPGLFSLDCGDQELALPVGGKADVKLIVKDRKEKQNGNLSVSRVAGPVLDNGTLVNIGAVNIAANKNDGVAKIQLPGNAQAGVFNLVFQGSGKFQVTDPKNKKKKDNVDFVASAPPIRLTIYDTVAKLELDKTDVALKAGATAQVKVKVTRLFKYAGEFKGELVAPSGSPGIKGNAFTIAKGAGEAILHLQAPKEAKPGVYKGFIVRVSAKIDNVTLKEEAKLQVALSDAKGEVAGAVKETTLLAEGADGWRYQPAAAVNGDAWRGRDFDDKAWKSGEAPLGYGEPDIAARKGTTVALEGQNIYCRHVVEVPAAVVAMKGASFRVRVASDNSAVVYVNGRLLDSDQADHEFSYWNRDVVVPANLFQPGRNVIAVELINTQGSSDAFLDLALSALVPEQKKK